MPEVLTIIGSPRKGNSFTAATEVEKLLSDRYGMDSEHIFLDKMHIETCTGCFACLKRGIEHCPLKDDVADILEKMMGADGIIFVSPVYVMNVSGLMKNFLDRLCSICHRPRFHGKYAMVLSTVGSIGLKETLKYMVNAVGSWQFRKVVPLGLKTPSAFDYRSNMTANNIASIGKQAKRFGEMIVGRSHISPGIMQVLQFRFQRAIFTSEMASEWPADGEFYGKLEGMKYYCDVRINPLYNIIGAMAEGIASKLMAGQFRKGNTAD